MCIRDRNSPELPVVIVEARSEGELKTIQIAQNNVAQADRNTSIVNSKDLSDCFHYDSGSQIIIGERIGNSMLELLKN